MVGTENRTLELLEHVVEVVLQAIFFGDQHAKTVLLDSGEGLGRIDAALVEDAANGMSTA